MMRKLSVSSVLLPSGVWHVKAKGVYNIKCSIIVTQCTEMYFTLITGSTLVTHVHTVSWEYIMSEFVVGSRVTPWP